MTINYEPYTMRMFCKRALNSFLKPTIDQGSLTIAEATQPAPHPAHPPIPQILMQTMEARTTDDGPRTIGMHCKVALNNFLKPTIDQGPLTIAEARQPAPHPAHPSIPQILMQTMEARTTDDRNALQNSFE